MDHVYFSTDRVISSHTMLDMYLSLGDRLKKGDPGRINCVFALAVIWFNMPFPRLMWHSQMLSDTPLLATPTWPTSVSVDPVHCTDQEYSLWLKMCSCQYRESHCVFSTVLRSCYLRNLYSYDWSDIFYTESAPRTLFYNTQQVHERYTWTFFMSIAVACLASHD